MDLPVRIHRAGDPPDRRVISVDGAWNAPGLNLSHWPGNETPAELRHDLSTGAALAFARLAPARRDELARGCVAIENNHYDTDGICALFAVRHPERALPRAERLLRAARAGDFFEWPDDEALVVDLIVHGLVDHDASPLASELATLGSTEGQERATEFLMERLERILDGETEPYRALWEVALRNAHADRRDLEACALDELAHLDWRIVTAPPERRSSRGTALEAFDPGRHALFADGASDRVLVVGPRAGGATYRLIFGTRSWFDAVSRPRHARPDLAELARMLNELERTSPEAELAWRAQDPDSPTPEVWFGLAEHELYAEHCAALRPSSLAPALARRRIAEALRSALALPA